ATMTLPQITGAAPILWLTLVGSAALVGYVYVGYPLLLSLLCRSRRRSPEGRAEIAPSITLIVPAYNEAKVIGEKIENALLIDYPPDRLEIVVASDGSDDGTNEIVRRYEPRGVRLRAFGRRTGKISVLNRTIPEASGDIVVLCDANVMFRLD